MSKLQVIAAALFAIAATEAATAQPIMPVRDGIDANTFIVGHPASPRWRVVHANQEHPAVAQARLASQASVNPNTYLVQPPASVQWLSRGDSIDAPTLALVAEKR